MPTCLPQAIILFFCCRKRLFRWADNFLDLYSTSNYLLKIQTCNHILPNVATVRFKYVIRLDEISRYRKRRLYQALPIRYRYETWRFILSLVLDNFRQTECTQKTLLRRNETPIFVSLSVDQSSSWVVMKLRLHEQTWDHQRIYECVWTFSKKLHVEAVITKLW